MYYLKLLKGFKWVIGLILVLGLLLFLVDRLSPNQIHLTMILEVPDFTGSWSGWLGYDELGRSVLERLLAALEPAFTIAIFVVSISMLLGVSIGLSSGFIGGWFDVVVVRIIDMFLAFPGLLLAILLSALLGPSLINVVIALSVVGWVGFARISRSQAMSLRDREFILAAKSQGIINQQIVLRHLLPLIFSPILVEATFAFAAAILAEAGLSFLGLGIQPPDPSWGQMIRTGAQYMLVAPHLVLVPGIALWLSILLINTAGESLSKRWQV